MAMAPSTTPLLAPKASSLYLQTATTAMTIPTANDAHGNDDVDDNSYLFNSYKDMSSARVLEAEDAFLHGANADKLMAG